MRHAQANGALCHDARSRSSVWPFDARCCSRRAVGQAVRARPNFADPIMAFNRDPVSRAYIDHVYEAREGARGALGSAGGGCGCN